MDEYEDIQEYLQIIYGEPETPSLLGDAETTTTHPLNINARMEPVPSQVQDRPRQPPSSSFADTVLQALRDLDQILESNRTVQALYTPSGEAAENVLASTETYQNLFTVPPLNFEFNELAADPLSIAIQLHSAYLASNQFNISSFDPGSSYYTELQSGDSQSQELHTSSGEAESVLASTETYQNLFTVPPLNFGNNEPSSVAADPLSTTTQLNSAYLASNQFNISAFDPGSSYYTELLSGDSQSQELHTPSGEAESLINYLLASTETENLATLPPLNETSGSSSIAADSSQQQFRSNQFNINIGSFDSYYTNTGLLSSSANQEAAGSSPYRHEQVVAPVIQNPLIIERKQMREDVKRRYLLKKSRRKFVEAYRYESRSEAAVKQKRLKGRFVKRDEEFDYDPDDDPPAQQ